MAERKMVIIDKRWCLIEDRSQVVPETSTRARWLHWTPGMRVPLSEAIRLGAVRESDPAPKPAQKAAQSPPKAGLRIQAETKRR